MQEVNHLICLDPSTEDQYILRLSAPVALIAVIDMAKKPPETDTDLITKCYDRQLPSGETQVVQLVAMPFNDGVSTFNLSTFDEFEWLLDSAWKWYCKNVSEIQIEEPPRV